MPPMGKAWASEVHPDLLYVDLFCGGGGSTTGALRAIKELGLGEPGDGSVRVCAVNHDKAALKTHEKNHPDVEHWNCDIEKLDPDEVLQGQQITILWQSAPCQDWSVAAGGPVKRPHQRATPEWMRQWVAKGRPKLIIEENVREVQTKWPGWKQHLQELRDMGYRVEVQEPDFADFGIPQNRKRMIMMAVRDDQPIAWPKPTHSAVGKDGKPKIPGTLPHRGAIEALDLSIPAPSMFGRKKWSKGTKKTRRRIPNPYSQMTRDRVAKYIREQDHFYEPVAKAVEENSGPVPMLDVLRATPVEQWPPWIQACGDHIHITAAEPFLTKFNRNGDGKPITEPAGSVMAEGGHHGVVVPQFQVLDPAIVDYYKGKEDTGSHVRKTDRAGPSITCSDRFALAQFTLGQQGGAVPHPKGEPVQTVATAGYIRVGELRCTIPANAGILPTRGRQGGPGSNPGYNAELPAPNVMAEQTAPRVVEISMRVANPALIPCHGENEGQMPRAHPGDKPAPTVATCANPRVAFIFLYTYNGKANATNLKRGATTVSTVERHMVVEVRLEDLMFDVGLRMCTVRELARFQSFPDSYEFLGTKEDMTRHIGNAVPPDGAYVYVKAGLGRKGMIRSRLTDFGAGAGLPLVAA